MSELRAELRAEANSELEALRARVSAQEAELAALRAQLTMTVDDSVGDDSADGASRYAIKRLVACLLPSVPAPAFPPVLRPPDLTISLSHPSARVRTSPRLSHL